MEILKNQYSDVLKLLERFMFGMERCSTANMVLPKV